MDKRIKIYIALFILIVVSIVYIESNKTKKINWFPSYNSQHKIPYGTYILREELPNIFPKTTVKNILQPPYQFLQDTTLQGTYFFINEIVNFGEEELNELINFVRKGNDVFIASNSFYMEELQVKTAQGYTTQYEEYPIIKLVNPIFKQKEYSLEKGFNKNYFKEVDSLHTTILGSLLIKDQTDSIIETKPNFIKIKKGKGAFYLHMEPVTFTNYGILHKNNHQYAADVLSYINDSKPIFWDDYYKTGKSRITSPMYYILSSKYLKWAYYIALIAVLLFVLFKGKRTQRYIPIITPLKNQTLAFTRTIANMYYEKSEHKKIATHKIDYFLEYIRTKYRLSTVTIDTEFYEKLANRSANTVSFIEEVFKEINQIQQQKTITKQQLIALNTLIEKFKTNNKE